MKRNITLLLITIFLILSACLPTIYIGGPPTQTPWVITTTTQPSQPNTSFTSQPTAAPILSPAPTEAAGLSQVNIYLIAIGDNGASGKKIGCDDSLVPVAVVIPPTLGVIRASLLELLKLKGERYYGQTGLYNALYLSDLSLESVNLVKGKATIKLTGSLVTGGVCDIPRIEAQLKESALQFSTVNEVSVLINDIPLEEVLSLQG